MFTLSDDWLMILAKTKRQRSSLYHVMTYITEILKYICGNCGVMCMLQESGVIYVIISNNFWLSNSSKHILVFCISLP